MNTWMPLIIVGVVIFFMFLIVLGYSLCIVASNTDEYLDRQVQELKDEKDNSWDDPRM